MAENVLYYGDNLEILRRYIKDESVDLVYIDPPFKSNQDYKITKKQLEYLAERVKKLQTLTKKICVAKIESFV